MGEEILGGWTGTTGDMRCPGCGIAYEGLEAAAKGRQVGEDALRSIFGEGYVPKRRA